MRHIGHGVSHNQIHEHGGTEAHNVGDGGPSFLRSGTVTLEGEEAVEVVGYGAAHDVAGPASDKRRNTEMQQDEPRPVVENRADNTNKSEVDAFF